MFDKKGRVINIIWGEIENSTSKEPVKGWMFIVLNCFLFTNSQDWVKLMTHGGLVAVAVVPDHNLKSVHELIEA